MIKKTIISIICLCTFIFAGGKVVYENTSQTVIECDDNKTVVILNKNNDEYITKNGEIFQSVFKAIEEKCK